MPTTTPNYPDENFYDENYYMKYYENFDEVMSIYIPNCLLDIMFLGYKP